MVIAGVDGPRLLRRLGEVAQIGADAGAVTRLAWTAEERQAHEQVAEWARQAGATVVVDAAGSLIAERPGTDPGLALVTGSHLDTVVRGGRLDGAYGVVAGIEVMASLEEAGTRLRHPLRVVAYSNEEGVMAPPFTGSRAVIGAVTDAELGAVGPDGRTLADRLRAAGGDPAGLRDAAWSSPVAATVELHIEQGPVLDTAAIPIGVVTAITGQRRGVIRVTGAANHAGTTPMTHRRDALVVAAHIVLAIEELALAGAADVATVGFLEARPNVANVIAGEVELSFDVRAADDADGDAAIKELQGRLAAIAASTATEVSCEPLPATPAVATDPRLRAMIAAAAAARDLRSVELPSGAGHDTAHLARLGPVAMIFVPSTGGVSHQAAESTTPEALVRGADVLLDVLCRADAELP
ncbi:MAG TPA: Zn-dependent hydrolase [Acidimicrobiales bacterium]